MRICIICGEEYEENYEGCPYCGCPGDYKIDHDPAFPEKFSERYSRMPVGSHQKMNETAFFWDNEKQSVVAAGVLEADENGKRMHDRLRKIQQIEGMDMFPEILEICEPGSEINGYYVYRKPDGLSLSRMVERRNPLSSCEVELIETELKKICAEWEIHHLQHGHLSLNNIWVSDGKIQIADYGNDMYAEDDQKCAERICDRLRNGFWIQQDRIIEKKGIAKLFSLRKGKRTYGD